MKRLLTILPLFLCASLILSAQPAKPQMQTTEAEIVKLRQKIDRVKAAIDKSDIRINRLVWEDFLLNQKNRNEQFNPSRLGLYDPSALYDTVPELRYLNYAVLRAEEIVNAIEAGDKPLQKAQKKMHKATDPLSQKKARIKLEAAFRELNKDMAYQKAVKALKTKRIDREIAEIRFLLDYRNQKGQTLQYSPIISTTAQSDISRANHKIRSLKEENETLVKAMRSLSQELTERIVNF